MRADESDELSFWKRRFPGTRIGSGIDLAAISFAGETNSQIGKAQNLVPQGSTTSRIRLGGFEAFARPPNSKSVDALAHALDGDDGHRVGPLPGSKTD